MTLPTLAHIGTDLAALVVLVGPLYVRRHHNKDLIAAYVGVNVGILAVTLLLSSTEVGAGLGLGLFGVLSIIRLRSTALAQHDVAYFFASLALGLLGGVGADLRTTASLMALVVAALWLGDHPALLRSYRCQTMVIDQAIVDERELTAYVARVLGATIQSVNVRNLDLVHNTTQVSVRFRLPAQRPRHLEPPRLPEAGHTGPEAEHVGSATRHDAPATGHAVPATRYTGPAAEHVGSATRHAGPVPRRTVPAVGHAGPATGHAVPEVRQAVPATRYTVPASDLTFPAVGHTGPAATRTSPTIKHTVPATGHSAPEVGHTSPEAEHVGSATGHTSPAVGHVGSATRHAGPAPRHTVPASAHAGPATGHAAPEIGHTSPTTAPGTASPRPA